MKDYMIMTIWEDEHPDVQLVDTLEEARAVTGYGSKPGVKYEVYHREVDDEDMINWMMVYRQ